MNEHELAQKLRDMYESAKRNEASCQVHLFGIMYAEEIKNSGCTSKRLIELSGINKGYQPEISKGIKLSQYVVPKRQRR